MNGPRVEATKALALCPSLTDEDMKNECMRSVRKIEGGLLELPPLSTVLP